MLSNEQKVIRSTFSANSSGSVAVPEGLIISLLDRFSSQKGYKLFDDVLPSFNDLQTWRKKGLNASTNGLNPGGLQVGIISNSDDRVSAILASLGIRVNDRTCGPNTSGKEDSHIDWIILSYDVGAEKPHTAIFDAARRTSAMATDSGCFFCHVGDSLSEDYQGAQEAGWTGVLLDRDDQYKDVVPGARRIQSLRSLMGILAD